MNIQSYLDYGDIMYDQAYNDSFDLKLGSYQFDSALLITGGIKSPSSEKLYYKFASNNIC